MDTLDNLTKSFDKLFVTTVQNILGANIEICKWSFVFTSIGVGINVLINSFYFIKLNNENKILKNKIDLLLNKQKIIIEENTTIYEFVKNSNKKIESIVENNNTTLQFKKDELEEYDVL